MDSTTLSRAAAIAWFVGSGIRIFVGFSGVSHVGDGPSPMIATSVGAVLGLAIGLALWMRPGRVSALVGIISGFYAVVGLVYLPLLNFDPGFELIAVAGVIAFVLSIAAFWRAQRERAAI